MTYIGSISSQYNSLALTQPTSIWLHIPYRQWCWQAQGCVCACMHACVCVCVSRCGGYTCALISPAVFCWGFLSFALCLSLSCLSLSFCLSRYVSRSLSFSVSLSLALALCWLTAPQRERIWGRRGAVISGYMFQWKRNSRVLCGRNVSPLVPTPCLFPPTLPLLVVTVTWVSLGFSCLFRTTCS